jgi:hypothetical protein
MSLREKLRNEIRAVALATLYFATWTGVLVVLKELAFAEYRIEFHGLSVALYEKTFIGINHSRSHKTQGFELADEIEKNTVETRKAKVVSPACCVVMEKVRGTDHVGNTCLCRAKQANQVRKRKE